MWRPPHTPGTTMQTAQHRFSFIRHKNAACRTLIQAPAPRSVGAKPPRTNRSLKPWRAPAISAIPIVLRKHATNRPNDAARPVCADSHSALFAIGQALPRVVAAFRLRFGAFRAADLPGGLRWRLAVRRQRRRVPPGGLGRRGLGMVVRFGARDPNMERKCDRLIPGRFPALRGRFPDIPCRQGIFPPPRARAAAILAFPGNSRDRTGKRSGLNRERNAETGNPP
jgi:hypothetical protein